jgi:hypothetical protein
MSLFDSLQSAAKCAVARWGFDYGQLTQKQLEHWARTYRVTVDQVDDAFRIAKNGSNKLPEEVAASASPATVQHEEEEE